MIKDKKILFFDIDCTLMFSDVAVTLADVNALNRAQQEGHYIVINSGRSFAYIPKFIKNMVNWDGYIMGSSHVVFHGKELLCQYMSKKACLACVDYANSRGCWVRFEGVEQNYCTGSVQRNCVTIDRKFIEDHYEDLKATKSTFNIRLDDGVNFDDVKTIRFPHYSECIIKGNNKATGMQVLLDELNMKKEDCIAFGDSVNDIDMLKFAPVSVIMASSPKELDEIATIRTESDDCGVSQGLKIVLGW